MQIPTLGLLALGFVALPAPAGAQTGERPAAAQRADLPTAGFERFVEGALEERPLPGVAVAVLDADGVLWTRGFGLADVENERAMTADTIMNIGSMSKTVTATAVMQLWEQGRFELDDDVDEYLPFSVRNPRFPDAPITFRQLLTHRSSIQDGPAYDASYALGDPTVPLGAWLASYFTEGEPNFDPEHNFHLWEPGTSDPPRQPRAYTNVGYGLLGYLVERISERPFERYCQEKIFAPLGMTNTGWHLQEIDVATHAVPYSYLDETIGTDVPLEEHLPRYEGDRQPREAGAFFPHGLYSFPNYPDGLLRTSVQQMSKHVGAILNGGALPAAQGEPERRILEEDTVAYMLSLEHFGRGLCWSHRKGDDGSLLWGHDGGDPGIATMMQIDPERGFGVIVFVNGPANGSIFQRLMKEAPAWIDSGARSRPRAR